ncbi:unnamed protein product [Penicillium salamii]|nr:unnamed protein product [Penicillium salamii]
MSQHTNQEFYGGAIQGVVPQSWIDSSTLREVPDHQELFLSPTTLSNLIIEINQRVPQEEALTASAKFSNRPAAPSGSATSLQIDHAACLYHLHDLCDEGDTMKVVTSPSKVDVQLASSSPSPAPIKAYRGVVSFTTPKKDAEPVSAGGTPPSSRLTCHYLLVRLVAQETDLLVFFNVPHEEFEKSGDPKGLAAEEALAADTISALVEKLQICDWGLFV